MLLKCCTQYITNLETSAVATGLEKVSFHSNSKEGQCQSMFKHCTVELISHASEVMLKILQQYVNWELPAVQAGFQRGRETRDQIVNIHWIMEKAREFQKNICFTDYATAFDSVDHNKLWKILKRWKYQTTSPVSWETCMQVKKEQLEPDWVCIVSHTSMPGYNTEFLVTDG